MSIITNGGLPDIPNTNYTYITHVEDAQRALNEIDRYDIIELDTETTALDPYDAEIVLLQLGVIGKSYVFDVRSGNVPLSMFKSIFEGTDKLKIIQNAVYDCKVIKTKSGIDINRVYDTMLAEQSLGLGLHPKANLQHLVAKYLHMRIPKDIALTFQDYNQEYQEYQLRYASNDVAVLRDIYNLQLPKLRQEGLMRVTKLEFDFIKSMVEMELNGMLLDVPQWQGILAEKIIERDRLRIQLSDAFNNSIDQNTMFGVSLINLDSPMQVVKALRSNGVQIESSDVKELNKHKKHPLVKLLLDYRKMEKFITTYGEPMIARIHDKTGRLHTSFRQMVSTGRMSSSDPNLQNIPKYQKYRSCFVARPGYKLLTCDMDGAELRIIANLSKDPLWVKIFNEGGDLHTVSAASAFGVSEETVVADKNLDDDDPNKKHYRNNSKPISFGLAYGLSEHGLSLRLGITKEAAKKMIDNYFKKYPYVQRFLEKSGRDAIRNGYATSIIGRKRYFKLPDPTDPKFRILKGVVERAGKNHPIQGSNADTIKQAMIYAVDRLEKYGDEARLLLSVHDELIVEARDDLVDEIKPIVEQSVKDGFNTYFDIVKMTASADVADYWVKG